jgi:hypothetical protein
MEGSGAEGLDRPGPPEELPDPAAAAAGAGPRDAADEREER